MTQETRLSEEQRIKNRFHKLHDVTSFIKDEIRTVQSDLDIYPDEFNIQEDVETLNKHLEIIEVMNARISLKAMKTLERSKVCC